MTCLDTDFIVDLLRRSPDAEKKLENLVSDGDKLNTTPLNASELYKGAYSSSRPLEEAKKVRRLLETLDILDFSVAASETFGKLSGELTRNGRYIGDFHQLESALICRRSIYASAKEEESFCVLVLPSHLLRLFLLF